jgi:hypothetical protein
LYISNREI